MYKCVYMWHICVQVCNLCFHLSNIYKFNTIFIIICTSHWDLRIQFKRYDSMLVKVKKEIESDIFLYTTDWIFYHFDLIIPNKKTVIECTCKSCNNSKLLVSSSSNVW